MHPRPAAAAPGGSVCKRVCAFKLETNRHVSSYRLFVFQLSEAHGEAAATDGPRAWLWYVGRPMCVKMCVGVAFRNAWPPLWVETAPALPRYSNSHEHVSPSLYDSHPIHTVSVYFCRSSI